MTPPYVFIVVRSSQVKLISYLANFDLKSTKQLFKNATTTTYCMGLHGQDGGYHCPTMRRENVCFSFSFLVWSLSNESFSFAGLFTLTALETLTSPKI